MCASVEFSVHRRIAVVSAATIVAVFLLLAPLPLLDGRVSRFADRGDVVAFAYPRAECTVKVEILEIRSLTNPPVTVGPDWSFYVAVTMKHAQNARVPATGISALPIKPGPTFTFDDLKKGETFNAEIFGVAMEDDTANAAGQKTGLPPLKKNGDLPPRKDWKQPGDDLGTNTWKPKAGQGGEGVQAGKLRCPGAGQATAVADTLTINVDPVGGGTEVDENDGIETVAIDFRITLDP